MATLEAMIVMIPAIFIMLFFMSYGFLFYQRWTVHHVANDVATRIAHTYANPEADPVMGFISGAGKAAMSPYRYIGKGLEGKNKQRGKEYAVWGLHISSLAYEQSEPEIEVEVVHDAFAQRHVKVKIRTVYEIPFGGALQYFGFQKVMTYEAEGYAVCTDLSDYVCSVNALYTLSNDAFPFRVTGTLEKILKLIDDVRLLFDKAGR